MRHILCHLVQASACLACFGCGPATTTRAPASEPAQAQPRDDAIARHDAAELKHAASFDPHASGVAVPCDQRPFGQCWQPRENPTAIHAQRAAEHRRAADAERKAAGWPRGVEEHLCGNISRSERMTSPLEDTEIQTVRALVERPSGSGSKLVGARVELRSSKTRRDFQTLVDCHVEHLAAMGSRSPEPRPCPLAVPGVFTYVREEADRLLLDIRAPDERSAAEVLERARAFAGRH
jgi:hypothetical protein